MRHDHALLELAETLVPCQCGADDTMLIRQSSGRVLRRCLVCLAANTLFDPAPEIGHEVR